MRWPKRKPRGWHRWFAWFPVKLGCMATERWAWLEYVHREHVMGMCLYYDLAERLEWEAKFGYPK